MTLDFCRRSDLPEPMVSDETDFATFRDCLVDLARVNKLTLAYRPTLQFFDQLAKSGRLPRNRAVVEMLRLIDRGAKRRGIKVDLTGVDRNPWSPGAATEVTDHGSAIRFVTADVFRLLPAARRRHRHQLAAHHLDSRSIAPRLRRGGLASRSRRRLSRGAARVSLPLCVSRVKA